MSLKAVSYQPKALPFRWRFVLPETAPSAFISYSREDTEFVMRLASDLKEAGANVWLDQLDIPAGERWDRAVEGALAGSPMMIVVLSAPSVASVNVMDEVSYALGKQKTVIPILIQDCAIPFRLLRIQHVDFRRDYARGMTALLKQLGVRDAGPVDIGQERTAQEAQQGAAERSSLEKRRERGPVNSKKLAVIGLGAAAAIAIVVLSVLLFRDKARDAQPNGGGGGTKPGLGTTPINNQPPAPPPQVVLPNAGSVAKTQPSNPPTAPLPVAPIPVSPAIDPIVGCYQWYNGVPVVIRANHTVTAEPFTATWRVVNVAKRAYTLTWPQPALDTIAVASNQQSVSGANQYGVPISGTRTSGNSGLVGTWNWVAGIPFGITIYSNGTYSAATSTGMFHGTWQPVYGSPGVYALKAAELPVDTVTLSADGARLTGANQYGFATSGSKTGTCAVN
jgi:hypothetical protein